MHHNNLSNHLATEYDTSSIIKATSVNNIQWFNHSLRMSISITHVNQQYQNWKLHTCSLIWLHYHIKNKIYWEKSIRFMITMYMYQSLLMALVSLPFSVLENWGLKKYNCSLSAQKLSYWSALSKLLNDNILMSETYNNCIILAY